MRNNHLFIKRASELWLSQCIRFHSYFAEALGRGVVVPQLDIDAPSPYPVDVMYLEEVLTKHRDNLPADTKVSQLRAICEFYGKTINDLVAMLDMESRFGNRHAQQ